MARQKRKVTHIHHHGRSNRPRTSGEAEATVAEDRPPVTRDLNQSASEPTEETSKETLETEGGTGAQEDSKVSTVLSLEEEDRLAEEEMKRVEEQYMQRKMLLQQKREEVERKKTEELARIRAEEERQKREEEERMRKKEEEERVRKAEEEQARAEEEERKRKEEEVRKKMEAEKLKAKETPAEKETPVRRRITRSGGTWTLKAEKSKKNTGKSPISDAGSSSENSDSGDSGGKSTDPHKTTGGTTHAPHGTPMQFTNNAARAHYEILAGQKLNLERGFDVDFLKENDFVRKRVEEQDWKTIVVPNRKANSSCVREFYAEAAMTANSKVKIRGVWVRYDAGTINRVLGLKTPKNCAFSRLMQEITTRDEAEILAALVVEGQNWKKEGARKVIPASSLTTEAAVWFAFLRHSLFPTTHDTDLSRDKSCLLFCILKGLPVNLGMIMHTAIFQARTRKKVSLPFPCSITALLIDAGVPTAPSDVWITSNTTISNITVQKMGRVSLASGGETSAVGTEVGTGGSKIDPRSGSAVRGGANLGSIVAELKEIKEQWKEATAHRREMDRSLETYWAYVKERDEVLREYLEKKDPDLAEKLPEFPPGICPEEESEDGMFESPMH